MLLSVLDRIILLNGVLPKEGSYQNLKLLRKTKEALSFDEEENRRLCFRNTDTQVRWNQHVYVNKATGDIVEVSPDLLVTTPDFVEKMVAKNPEAFEMEEAVPSKEFDIGKTVTGLIVSALESLDKSGKLTENHFELYEKFIPEEKGE